MGRYSEASGCRGRLCLGAALGAKLPWIRHAGVHDLPWVRTAAHARCARAGQRGADRSCRAGRPHCQRCKAGKLSSRSSSTCRAAQLLHVVEQREHLPQTGRQGVDGYPLRAILGGHVQLHHALGGSCAMKRAHRSLILHSVNFFTSAQLRVGALQSLRHGLAPPPLAPFPREPAGVAYMFARWRSACPSRPLLADAVTPTRCPL